MSCLYFLVASAIVYTIAVASPTPHRNPGYLNRPNPWRNPHHVDKSKQERSEPFDYGYGSGSSEEEHDLSRYRPHRPDYGHSGSHWWRPSYITERPQSNQNSNLFLKLCIQNCPVTPEYNPVCGSNNVSYPNPSRLECEQHCGVAVTLQYMGPCSDSGLNENPISDPIANCLRSCPVTGEYNPVCGSDGVTYSNPGRFECAQNCGVEVKLSRKTACDAPFTTEQTIIINSTKQPDIDVHLNGNKYPMSENNGVNNATSINNNVNGTEENNINQPIIDNGRAEEGNVSANGTKYREDNKTKEENSDEDELESKTGPGDNRKKQCKGVKQKSPSVTEVMECMQTCTLTSESNPICGTDSITYMNPGRLLCAQFCGVDVRVKKFAPCNSSSLTNVHCLTPCTNPPVTEDPDYASTFEGCMKACPASTEFKPVCGSNNITYGNLEKLQCARRCGLDVNLTRNTLCSAPEVKPNPTSTVQDCIQQCYIPHKLEPICGSDNVTYNNTGHLICARQCGLEVEVKHFSACVTGNENNSEVSTSSTIITTDKAPIVTPGPNGLNFTIDPAILASIWSEATNPPPSAKDDDDEDLDLDQRIKD